MCRGRYTRCPGAETREILISFQAPVQPPRLLSQSYLEFVTDRHVRVIQMSKEIGRHNAPDKLETIPPGFRRVQRQARPIRRPLSSLAATKLGHHYGPPGDQRAMRLSASGRRSGPLNACAMLRQCGSASCTEPDELRALVRAGFRAMLDARDGIEIGAGAGADAVDLARRLVSHLVLMHIRMPGMVGLEATHSCPRRNRRGDPGPDCR